MAAVAFSLPNLLSLLRMALVPLFIIAITRGAALEALLLFALASRRRSAPTSTRRPTSCCSPRPTSR